MSELQKPGKRHRQNAELALSSASAAMQIPISTGKPSLRRRLEDYYSLIAPDTISNEAGWRRKFELIYDKYGGTTEKELALARKLAKKYGITVRLKLTTNESNSTGKNRSPHIVPSVEQRNVNVRAEEYYTISSSQEGSGILEFTSDKFDPHAALHASNFKLVAANPFAASAPLLNYVDQFRTLLPFCDPQRREPVQRSHRKRNQSADNEQSVKTENMKNKIPVFTSLAAQYENSGPLSLLHSIHVQRQRVRVMVRYVDCIRGTLTGYLIAFDKHMNLLLRDVDEVYTSRLTKVIEDADLSKSELELERRKCTEVASKRGNGDAKPHNHRVKVGKRHMHQLLVRGDNVVSIWKAGDDRPSSLFHG